MRYAETLIIAASIGLSAGAVSPSAHAGVVIGVSIPVPVVAAVAVATVPVAPLYVNPYYRCGYRAGYRSYRPGIERGGHVYHRR
jgi:hypothetical protein